MGSRPGRLVAFALLVAAVAASTASAAGVRVLFAGSANRTHSNRTARTIDRIVIHSTEGGFAGSVRWLQNRRSRGSAHYVVSRRGQIVQLVSTSDVAWHAGNRRVNRRSIGIEHEGWSRRVGFTPAQYRASARLVAYLAHRFGIPLDREHVIGHAEVPDPRRPWLSGGASHHTDPGPRWRWGLYMRLLRRAARDPEQPRYVRSMVLRSAAPPPAPPGSRAAAPERSVVDRGADVRGTALWWSGVDRSRRRRFGIRRVDFLVDGRLLWTDRVWPFAFRGGRGWDTRTVANGRHLLVVRAYGRRGYRARKLVPVRVVNPPMRLRVAGAGPDGIVHGLARLAVRTGEPTSRVVLWVDGRAVSRDRSAPFRLRWDTRAESEGAHRVVLTARGRSGRRASARLVLTVANAEDLPQSLRAAWGRPADGWPALP